MSVKGAVDYYNTSDIRVGDIVIINDSGPQSCENDRIVEPYTRLRVRALEMEQYSGRGEIRARLETEYDEIPLANLVNLLNMRGELLIHKAEDWLKATNEARNVARERCRLFGRLNPRGLFVIYALFWIPVISVAASWPDIRNLPVTPFNVAGVLSTAVVLGMALIGSANVIVDKISAMDKARKSADALDELLRLYRQANPSCTETTAVSGKD